MIGPTIDLEITISGPAHVLLAGETFTITITVSHGIRSTVGIQLEELFFAYLQEYLIPPENFTAIFGNGNVEVFGKWIMAIVRTEAEKLC